MVTILSNKHESMIHAWPMVEDVKLGLLDKLMPPLDLGMAVMIPPPLGRATKLGLVLNRPLARVGPANLGSSRGS